MLYEICNGNKSVLVLALLAILLTVISRPFERLAKERKKAKPATDFDFSFDFDDYINERCS